MKKCKKQDTVVSPEFTRNLSIISHVDHGKTTLSDHLIASGGLLPEHLAGSLRALDFLPEEQKRGITIESSIATFQINYQNQNYQINLIDTPGHVDFSGKVAESLRVVDGALIIVDAVEGIMAQTKTVLKQAIREKLVTVLFINKIDRLINELELHPAEIQSRIQRIIGELQSIFIILGANKNDLPNFAKSTVLIGSALHGWAIDNQYVKNGGKLDEIINIYYQESKFQSPIKLNLGSIMKRTLVNVFPNPIEGQQIKFPKLFSSPVPKKFLADIHLCSAEGQPIILIGRLLKFQNIRINGYLIRVLSGVIKRGTKLKSSSTGEIVKVHRIVKISGRTSIDVTQLTSGQIGGISSNNSLPAGDLLTLSSISDIKLSDISYVQEAVVAISIEPHKINEIGRLQDLVEGIVNRTPGLRYESNSDTGELIALGVGTLQLDILVSELNQENLEIEVSDPKILQFEMPTLKAMIQHTTIDELQAMAGYIPEFNFLENKNMIISDPHSNHLVFQTKPDREAREGMIEVFRQYMRISPKSGIKIKNFILILQNYPSHKKYQTYENGIILGSSLIKQALSSSKSMIHEPFYTIEISLPEKYLGPTIQELQRVNSNVEQIETGKFECKIHALIPVQEGIKLADTLRQITDGNVFWSFPSTRFLPVYGD